MAYDFKNKFYNPTTEEIKGLDEVLELTGYQMTDTMPVKIGDWYLILNSKSKEELGYWDIDESLPPLADHDNVYGDVYVWQYKYKSFEDVQSQYLVNLNKTAATFDDQLVNNDMLINSSLGFKANADLRSQNNVQGLIDLKNDSSNFRDADNNFHQLSLGELNTLKLEMIQNGQNLYLQKWTKASQIQQAISIEDLEKISLDFQMMDFSLTEKESSDNTSESQENTDNEDTENTGN